MSITLGIGHASCNENCPCKNITTNLSIWTCALEGYQRILAKKIHERPSLVNLPDSYGYIALHYASQRGHIDMVKFLISSGSLIDGLESPDGCGATPLHRSAYNGHLEVCKILIAAGANVDARDKSFQDERTPLMKAASKGHHQVMDLLIQHGSDTSLVDSQRLTYLQILNSHEDKSIENKVERIENEEEYSSFPIEDNYHSGITCSICHKQTLAVMSLKGQIVCLQCGKMNSWTY